jgi:hypothetical protein
LAAFAPLLCTDQQFSTGEIAFLQQQFRQRWGLLAGVRVVAFMPQNKTLM